MCICVCLSLANLDWAIGSSYNEGVDIDVFHRFVRVCLCLLVYWLVFSCPVLSSLGLALLGFAWLVLSCPTLSCLAFSCRVLSCLVWSSLDTLCPVLSCFALSCLVLSVCVCLRLRLPVCLCLHVPGESCLGDCFPSLWTSHGLV